MFRVISLTFLRRHWPLGLALLILALYGPWMFGRLARTPTKDPGLASRVVTRFSVSSRWVALAFEDGPNPPHTTEILQLLQRYHAHATFFAVGLTALRFPSCMALEVQRGMEVGNHSEGHINLATHSFSQDVRDLSWTNRTLRSLSGQKPYWLSPPYGAVNRTVLKAAQASGLQVVLPSQGEGIANGKKSASAIVRQVMTYLKTGDIIMFHDGVGNRATLEALPVILRLLTAQGYHIGTLSEVQARVPNNIGR